MEKKALQVVTSKIVNTDLVDIHNYGAGTFGMKYADFFIAEIYEEIAKLSFLYEIHPECRQLTTKSKKYRNIILGAYLIIYRHTPERVEVLRAIHGSRSKSYIRTSRSVIVK